jgi:hypothetical protein
MGNTQKPAPVVVKVKTIVTGLTLKKEVKNGRR